MDAQLDQAIGDLASRQAGVVARRQLDAIGIGRGAVERRVRRGVLRHVPGHRGVFAVGHTARGPRTSTWAAHLALGPSSVVSHRTAAALWELAPGFAGRVELTVEGTSRGRAAIAVHRTTWLPAQDVTRRDGLPVTGVARTLLDLGAVAPPRQVERAFDQADVLRLLDERDLARVLDSDPSRPGAAVLRSILARDAAGSTLTANDLEERMLGHIRRARLPAPVLQHPVLGYRADFCWPAARLIVETDGGGAHATPRAWRRDARRDVRLTNAGWTVLRFPRADVLSHPGEVTHAIRTALTIAGRVLHPCDAELDQRRRRDRRARPT